MSDSYRYVIGDVHGCINTLRTLVEERIQLQKKDKLYLLGDYIDRGPDAKGVIDYLMDLISESYSVLPLLGNHEEMFLNAFNGHRFFRQWLMNGAKMTFKSFGLKDEMDSLKMIPPKYIEFVKSLCYYICMDEFVLVHAGMNFKTDDPFKDRYAMLWSREFQYESEIIGNRKIIHGHTPKTLNEIKSTILNKKSDLINIDAGCVYSNSRGYGNLIALNLDTWEIFSEKNIG